MYFWEGCGGVWGGGGGFVLEAGSSEFEVVIPELFICF